MRGDQCAVCPAQGLSVLQEQGLDGAGLVRAAASLPSSLVTCKPHPMLCGSQCSRLGLGLVGTHLSHTPQPGSNPGSQHTACVGPSETLLGASSPGPAGLIIIKETGGQAEEMGRGRTAAHNRLTRTATDTESHRSQLSHCSYGLCQAKEGHSLVIAIKLVSHRGPRGGSSQPVRNASHVKACILHTYVFTARDAYSTPEEFFKRTIPVEPKPAVKSS